MPVDVVAFPRRQGVFLALVTAEEETRKGPMLSLVAEDGARFRLPTARVVTRAQVTLERRDGEDEGAWLTRLRDTLEPLSDWLALRGRLDDGDELTVGQVAEAAGLSGDDAALRVAIGAPAGAPWFERRDGRFTVVPMKQALLRLFDLSRARFEAAGEAAVAAWWEAAPQTRVPAAWPAGLALSAALAEERARFFEPGYQPDDDLAGAAALEGLVRHALTGDAAAADGPAQLARRLGRGEDPDLLVEDLVERGAFDPATDPSAHRAGLAAAPDDDVLGEAERVAAMPVDDGARTDLTQVVAVAVDGPGTVEVDDAVSLRRVDGAVELLVHVADCGRIAAGSALDAWARERATSLYVPDGASRMFPRDVVDALSLSEDARPALTLVVTLDDDLRVAATRFERSVVRLARRATYRETEDVAVLASTAEDGALLVRIAAALRAARLERGARIVQTPSLEVSLADGAPVLRLRTQDTPGDVVVSECMVLYNAAAAARLAAASAAALFRSQDGERGSRREPPDPDDPLFELRVRRSFAPTLVTTEPAPHTGVGAEEYLQITSPIRRYGDLANQRQLDAVLCGRPVPLQHADVEGLAEHLAQRERRVRRASDARSKYWVARHLETSGVQTLEGLLSRPPRRGVGAVWVPALRREVTLKCERSWRPPPEGTAATWRLLRVLPWRGRIEVEPVPEGA